jgi:hypothetical protein
MPPDTLAQPLLLGAAALAVLGAVLLLAGLVALARVRVGSCVVRVLAGALMLSLGTVLGAVTMGIQGYRALTHEALAAHLTVRPAGPQRFAATLRFPDGRELSFDLAGDELYVDAHILKWKPVANLVGLHTAYELDRVAGRYRSIDQERNGVRTVYSLARTRAVDLFGLRQQHAFLEPLLDAEYGSATFVPVNRPAELELRVSTTGLLVRELKPAAKSK